MAISPFAVGASEGASPSVPMAMAMGPNTGAVMGVIAKLFEKRKKAADGSPASTSPTPANMPTAASRYGAGTGSMMSGFAGQSFAAAEIANNRTQGWLFRQDFGNGRS